MKHRSRGLSQSAKYRGFVRVREAQLKTNPISLTSSRTSIFEEVAAPSRRGIGIGEDCQWFTWSTLAWNVLRAIEADLDQLSKPKLIHLQHKRRYDHTYTVRSARIEPELRSKIELLASALSRFDPGEGVVFLTGLLPGKTSRASLRYFLAAIRASIVWQQGSKWAALYAPLAPFGEEDSDFPLHCDLYRPQILWNIFDEVPADGSGASTFLPTRILLAILDGVPSFPRRQLAQVRECLSGRLQRDRYEWLYDVLHGTDHAWVSEVARKMESQQLSIPLSRGEGYILNDRKWLHGREVTRGGVSILRSHRLIFDLAR